ncbi:MAG: HesA/MoeB/ThiF family protein [Candidatus Verstraetearchaeota archaeon]|nr:HesA/MoeB/ThiF family protein [Candidatus Verstraetearchaeota archaeon]
MSELTPTELERYDRQIRIPRFGVEGQKKLKAAKVTVVGVGGLGCPVSIYLTAAGVGKITIIDKDRVELSNLNRQILHWEKDINRYKVDSAKEKLSQLNPFVEIEGKVIEITEDNVIQLLSGSDIVIDGMDNFKTRLILNKACVELRIPFIHAAIYGLEGELLTVLPGEGPCYQCFLQKAPPERKPFPVLGVTPAVMACLQAMETIKIITGCGKPSIGRVILFDGENMRFDSLNISRDPNCPVCKGL